MEAMFKVIKWEETPVSKEAPNFPVNIVHAEYEFTGLLTGTAYVEYLLYYLESNMEDEQLATARIVGFLHFEGMYQGKTGTFTATERGIFDKGRLDSPGMLIKAGGDLADLTGSYQYEFIGQESRLIFDFSQKGGVQV